MRAASTYTRSATSTASSSPANASSHPGLADETRRHAAIGPLRLQDLTFASTIGGHMPVVPPRLTRTIRRTISRTPVPRAAKLHC